MFKYFVLFILLSSNLYSQTFSIGKFSIGEDRININLDDFIIKHENKELVGVGFIKNSVQWIRNESNLLSPRALLSIGIKSTSSQINISHFDKSIYPSTIDQFKYTEIYIDLYNPGEINIYDGTTLIDKINIQALSSKNAKAKQLIDYSCSPYNVEITGVDDEYISIGCKLNRTGKLFDERPRLEITFNSTNLKSINNTNSPYTFYVKDNSPIEFQLKNTNNEIKNIKISAKLPKKLNRFKTALGFGPYLYDSGNEFENATSNFAPSLMIYGKFDLTETTSLKAFDALLYSKTLFNNSGLYLSYDLAEIFDGRVLLNTLLGFQGLHYRFSKNYKTEFRLIYPQGFEAIYKHAFGVENYHLTYGMFFSTSSETYTNLWLRYGKSSFLELNYIQWGHLKSEVKMWGISVGVPFFSIL